MNGGMSRMEDVFRILKWRTKVAAGQVVGMKAVKIGKIKGYSWRMYETGEAVRQKKEAYARFI